MNDWLEHAAASIVRDWSAWEAEAGQIAQNKQDYEAGQSHLRICVLGRLRWLRANHSRAEEEES